MTIDTGNEFPGPPLTPEEKSRRRTERRIQAAAKAMKNWVELDPCLPPASFLEQLIPGIWAGSRLLYLGADRDQFSYHRPLQVNCINTDVLECSPARCKALRQSYRWLHDIVRGWIQFVGQYSLDDYDTVMWVNGPSLLPREESLSALKQCTEILRPKRLIVISELAPPDDPDEKLAREDVRKSIWTPDDFLELGFNAKVWPANRGAVIAWKNIG